MAFLGPIPSIFVEAILTCLSSTNLAPEIYDILYPSNRRLLGWNLKWLVSSHQIDELLWAGEKEGYKYIVFYCYKGCSPFYGLASLSLKSGGRPNK